MVQRNVGRVLDAQGRLDAALEAYRVALAITKQLAAVEPSDVATQRDLLRRYSELALLQERRGSLGEAQESYCRARDVVRTLIELDPQGAEWRDSRISVEQRLQATQDGAASC